MVAVILVGVAGFFAATGLTSVTEPAADASNASEVVLVETVTIERAVVKRVRVVRRVTERSGVRGKRVELVTVTTPARIERRLVPVVKKYLVTVPGPRRTIVETRTAKHARALLPQSASSPANELLRTSKYRLSIVS